jgi:hypothetical protein
MLDAFIIEKIQRDREHADHGRRLQIEKRPPPGPDAWKTPRGQLSEDDSPKRGVAVIDFTV